MAIPAISRTAPSILSAARQVSESLLNGGVKGLPNIPVTPQLGGVGSLNRILPLAPLTSRASQQAPAVNHSLPQLGARGEVPIMAPRTASQSFQNFRNAHLSAFGNRGALPTAGSKPELISLNTNNSGHSVMTYKGQPIPPSYMSQMQEQMQHYMMGRIQDSMGKMTSTLSEAMQPPEDDDPEPED